MRPEERGELEAFRDMFAVAPEGVGAGFAMFGEALAIRLAAVPAPLLNRVMGLGGDVEDAELDSLEEFFPAGIRYYVQVTPDARALSDRLAERGFTPDYHWQKFARPVEPLPLRGTELRIAEVGADRGGDFAAAFVGGYGVPSGLAPWFERMPGRSGWRCFVGYAGDEPAAAGALFLSGTTGWLGLGATVPAHRGRGGQGAILAARIAAAGAAGCTEVVTETGVRADGRPQISHDNIERVGFRPTYVRENWLSPPR